VFHSSRLWPYPQTLDELERLTRNKHFSFLQKFANYGRKKLVTSAPGLTFTTKTNGISQKSLFYIVIQLLFISHSIVQVYAIIEPVFILGLKMLVRKQTLQLISAAFVMQERAFIMMIGVMILSRA
jgi:hypothetical protein